MKLVKAIKNYRNRTVEHLMVAYAPYDEEVIQSRVESWAENDSAGQSYGYTGEWEFVDDPETLNRLLREKLVDLDEKIDRLRSAKTEILQYLQSIPETH